VSTGVSIIIRRNGTDYGPYALALVEAYLREGQLKPGDLARRAGEPPDAAVTLASLLAGGAGASAVAKPVMIRQSGPVPFPAGTAVPVKRKAPRRLSMAALAALVFSVAAAAFTGWLIWQDSQRKMGDRAITRSTPAEAAPQSPELPVPAEAIEPARPTPAVAKPTPLSLATPSAARSSPPDYTQADAKALAMGAQTAVPVLALAKTFRAQWTEPGPASERWLARCIFRWITENVAYDSDALRVRRLPAPDPDYTLRVRSAVCEGYSGLFTSLCQELGIEAVTVTGFSHTQPNEIGRPIEANNPGHAWNAAKVDGQWIMLDATFGAGGLAEGQFKKKLELDWFDVPPERMILSHLPDAAKWQMLELPVTREQFVAFPVLKAGFFRAASFSAAMKQGSLAFRDPLVQFEAKAEVEWAAHLTDDHGKEVAKVRIARTRGNAAGPGREYTRLELAQEPAAARFLEIFAHQPDDPPNTFPAVAIFRLTGPPRAGREGPPPAEPKFFRAYQARRAHLDQPLTLELPAEKSVRFRIEVPGAANVRLMHEQEEYFLHRGEGDWYEANLRVPAGKSILYAAFPEAPEKLEGLVEYLGK
jgi:transglutaminase-like putative cysteine protease